MNKVRIVAAVLLALPLLVFGGSFYIHPFALPPANGSAGIELLYLMRNGGLTYAITVSHVLAGVFLLVPRTRFVAALLQLPMTIRIVSFHAIMWRSGDPGCAHDVVAESHCACRTDASAGFGRAIIQGSAGKRLQNTEPRRRFKLDLANAHTDQH